MSVIAILLAMTDKSMPHGLAVNNAAPFSGQLEDKVIEGAINRRVKIEVDFH